MSREIKFRVWDPASKKLYYEWPYRGRDFFGFESIEGGDCLLILPRSNGSLSPAKVGRCISSYEGIIWEQFTGIKDSKGVDIYEGDILLAYEARYESEKLDDIGGAEVYLVDTNKPLSTPDVPFFRASVEWYTDFCGFYLTYLWQRPDWAPAASCQLQNHLYQYEVIGNIHENPNLLDKDAKDI